MKKLKGNLEDLKIIHNNPFDHFLEKYSFQTPVDIHNRLNQEVATSIYLNYPFKNDPELIKMKNNLIELNCELPTNENP